MHKLAEDILLFLHKKLGWDINDGVTGTPEDKPDPIAVAELAKYLERRAERSGDERRD